MKNVHVDAVHECDVCKRKFRQKKNLKLHIMIVHVRETKFICTRCGRKFTNQIAWKQHDARASVSISISSTTIGDPVSGGSISGKTGTGAGAGCNRFDGASCF